MLVIIKSRIRCQGAVQQTENFTKSNDGKSRRPSLTNMCTIIIIIIAHTMFLKKYILGLVSNFPCTLQFILQNKKEA